MASVGVRSYDYRDPASQIGAAPTLEDFLLPGSPSPTAWNPFQPIGPGYGNPAQPPQYDREAYQQALSAYNAQKAGIMAQSGFNPDGSPIAPELISLIDEETGQLKDAYQLEASLLDPETIRGFQKFEEFATGVGPSAHATAAQEQLDLQTAFERDRASAEAAGQAAQARSALAMRGGLSSGARERLGAQSMENALLGRQQARQAQLMGTADIMSQDALSRQNALQSFTGLSSDLAQFNSQQEMAANEFNIQQALLEINAERKHEFDTFAKEQEKFAAERKAQSEEKIARCFAYGQEIEMADGTNKPIQDLVIGDVTKLGGKVTALYMASNEDLETPVYNYKGILVSSMHPVYHDGKWMRVKDTGTQLTSAKCYMLYDVSTQYHKLVSQGVIFGDYDEVDKPYAGEQECIDILNSEPAPRI